MADEKAAPPAIVDDDTPTDSPEREPEPYTVFNSTQKRAIAIQASLSAIFSGLSSFIYYPALRPLADALHVSQAAINLTVSAYLIVAGIFPSILGDISDQRGRRVASLLAFTLYLSANLGIALQHDYAALVVLRCLQSAGAAGTIAIAYGVVADITTPAERGSYVGIVLGATNAAPSIGPVLGGVLAQELSWRWIFWLLVILSGTHLAGLVLFFPETSRKLVGNGSWKPPSRWNQSLVSLFCARRTEAYRPAPISVQKRRVHLPNPFVCLRLLFNKPNFIVILIGSIQYAVFSALGTSLAANTASIYSLNDLDAGLLYLPSGIGGLVAAILTGRLLDHDYQRVACSLPRTDHHQQQQQHTANDVHAFPLEHARLRSVFPILAVTAAATIGYGWTLEAQTHIAAPLVLQFLTGATQVALFVVYGTLLTDYNQDRSATAQASYNLVRCALAAGFVAALEPFSKAVGVGWAFTCYGLLGLLCVPLLLVLRTFGWQWRKKMAADGSLKPE